MGMHFLDLIIVAGIGLALFGPKALQSMARNAGKGIGQAKIIKDQIMSELPMEDIAKITEYVPRFPLNSRHAMQMLITPEPAEEAAKEPTTATAKDNAEQQGDRAK
jgi:Sec-independent protein translocase protein TatA